MSKGLTNSDNILRIAICDYGEKLCRSLSTEITGILKDTAIEGTVDQYSEVEQLIKEEIFYDIIFLFWDMEKANCLQKAQSVKNRFKYCRLILISEETKYMQDAFKVQPFRYLLLPCADQQLREAICSARDEDEDKTGFILQGEGNYHTVFKKNIICIESLGDEIAMITDGNDHFILRMTLKEMYDILKEDFLKCSREKVVNMKHIVDTGEREVILDNGMRITVSYRENRNVKERYREYRARIAGMRWLHL